jgi:hypothetical protein
MANRYQDRPFPSAADQDRGESDPLAELARLIGQNDPLGAAAKPAARPLQSRANIRPQQYDQQQYDLPEELPDAPQSPPAWMQRARHETPLPPPPLPQEYDQKYDQKYDDEPEYQQPAPVHPLHRYAAQPPQLPPHQAPPEQDYYEQPQQQYADEPLQDPSRYDDALYGRLETGEHDYQRDPAYPDDPYAYQGEYEEEPAPKKRSSGLMTVVAVLALAVVGTGAAFAYRTFVGSPRSGEPPIIRADNSPTKVVPAQSDASAAKNPDRMLSGDGGEKLVSREETPVDVNSRSGAPRVVFPPLNQNANPPPASSVSPSAPMPAATGTMPNNEPRRIKTLAVKGDAADNGGIPAGASAPPPRPPTRSVAAPAAAPAAPPARNPASANASANAPMSLGPQAGESEPPTRVAATNPTQTAPASEGGPSFLVSVTSQDSESAARESFRVAQGKYASVLGSRSPVIKRVDLADGKTKYRAMVGPYRTRQEAVQFCTELKSAGGQCFIP